MTNPLTTKEVRSVLLARIASGAYDRGDRLPSVRQLGAELGVNRNTASKVYQKLHQEGIVRSLRGRGVFVANMPEMGDHFPAERQVEELLHNAFSYAALAGLSRQRLKNLVSRQFREIEPRKVRIAFIECNLDEAREIAQRMEQALGCSVDALVLDALPRASRLLKTYRIVATTLYHLGEVQDRVGRENAKVIGLQHSPSIESVLEIARLERGTRIAVTATNRRTLNVLLKLAETYHDSVVGSCITNETVQVRQLAKAADVLIVHPLAKRRIPPHLAPRVITVTFQIEPQSLDYLRQGIAKFTDGRRKQRMEQPRGEVLV